ncbi:hypothetical protein FKM82_003974 [Ascaphus truei]
MCSTAERRGCTERSPGFYSLPAYTDRNLMEILPSPRMEVSLQPTSCHLVTHLGKASEHC